MSYLHRMTCQTEGIRATDPVRWRSLDGMMGVFWRAEGQAGARGYYLSPDPRIVVFLNDVSGHIRISNRDGGIPAQGRPMMRALYVPAGVPMWSRFTDGHRFSHLDLHLHRDRLLHILTPAVGGSEALAVLRRPVEIGDAPAIATLTGLLVDELSQSARHPAFAESLAGSIAAGLLDIPAIGAKPAAGGLTPAQMRKLVARLKSRQDHRMTVAEMAATVGLSESWFAAVFKQTTGQTPLQWQMGQRIAQAQRLLTESDLTVADVAARLGFSDQAHLTRAFRQVAGETPAAWRRMQRAGHLTRSGAG
ncbi:helix-turn-helix domain-containing protein [Paracoccus benzoatiresistens]|uniref:AraC family transcriptional regulator n=1 Tax=Paracoccus benzoatiresistens TaxID=2997341 RepID=A0ABT4J2M4_9RHOB|nr:AraC family transcriptional regulator [Paracoccus sp. EF6]MCZ0961348.1 AraC family transcriptional regulator [Paracoccus sp. EF6]